VKTFLLRYETSQNLHRLGGAIFQASHRFYRSRAVLLQESVNQRPPG
jgi:hypothetical protein